MSKYLIPVLTDDDLFIESTSAKSICDAETKFINKFTRDWNLDVPADWEEFCEFASVKNCYVGEIIDIEEF